MERRQMMDVMDGWLVPDAWVEESDVEGLVEVDRWVDEGGEG